MRGIDINNVDINAKTLEGVRKSGFPSILKLEGIKPDVSNAILLGEYSETPINGWYFAGNILFSRGASNLYNGKTMLTIVAAFQYKEFVGQYDVLSRNFLPSGLYKGTYNGKQYCAIIMPATSSYSVTFNGVFYNCNPSIVLTSQMSNLELLWSPTESVNNKLQNINNMQLTDLQTQTQGGGI